MLSAEARRALRARAHHLKPVVLIGQFGVTPPVLAEIDGALDAHELIKIRFRGAERAERGAAIDGICAELGAEPVQCIGGTAVLFRKRREERRPKRRKS